MLTSSSLFKLHPLKPRTGPYNHSLVEKEEKGLINIQMFPSTEERAGSKSKEKIECKSV